MDFFSKKNPFFINKMINKGTETIRTINKIEATQYKKLLINK